jgi:hypothetical protein
MAAAVGVARDGLDLRASIVLRAEVPGSHPEPQQTSPDAMQYRSFCAGHTT